MDAKYRSKKAKKARESYISVHEGHFLSLSRTSAASSFRDRDADSLWEAFPDEPVPVDSRAYRDAVADVNWNMNIPSPIKAFTPDRSSLLRFQTPSRYYGSTNIPSQINSTTSDFPKIPSLSSVSSGEDAKSITPTHSVFSQKQKRFIAIIASLSSLLPYFASNIFYPVIDLIAEDLHVSVNQINLTITAYLLFQGLAPSFIGNLSDCWGRRPALMLAFSVFIAGSLGTAYSQTYTALIITRCLQSAGSSGTVAIASAMVTDIVTSAQRGTYYSYVQLGGMMGFSLGPVIGGLLSHVWGWRSIFWFLTAFASFVFLTVVLFLPETSRNIVDNGSVAPQKWNNPVFTSIKGTYKPLPKAKLNPLEAFTLFFRWETCILLMYAGLLNSTQFYVFTTLPVQFQRFYNFSTVSISLVYLATGAGTAIAVLISGRMQDFNFRRHAKKLGMTVSNEKQQSMSEFPIEVSRLQTSFPALLVSLLSLIAYGWFLQTSPPLGPILFIFFWAAGNNAAFTSFSNLIVDLNRDKAGSATAAINVARCWTGAAVVAFSNPLTELIGIAYASMVVVAYMVLLFPLLMLVYCWGQKWRAMRSAEEGRSDV